MAGQTLLAPGVARTERGLVVAGTRITLYAIIDRINYHGGNATNADIQERFVLSEQQVADVLAYIAAHREEVEAEYRQVLREAEELEQYYAERNREVLARVAALPPSSPQQAAVRARLAELRARRGEA